MYENEQESAGQRSKLKVHNDTDFQKGPGAELHLKWSGDTRPEGQESFIPLRGFDSKESKYVQGGNNFRTFGVKVYKGDIHIGDFNHVVYNPPGGAGRDDTYINVEYYEDEVTVYRKYLPHNAEEQSTEIIGTISVEDWES